MQETHPDFEELEQTQFPAFPVVFRQQPKQNSHSRMNLKSRATKGLFKMPDKDIEQLQTFISYSHNTTYPQLFKQTWEDGLHNIDNFFAIYQSLDNQFVDQMKRNKQTLRIVRLSTHKVYIGEFKQNVCAGMSIIIFKNGNIYEGMMQNNKRQGRGYYQQSGQGYYKGNFNNDIKNGDGIEVIYKKWAFKGQFLNGLRHQKGLYVENSGLVYYGQWKLGIMHGKAVLKTDQLSYNGMFVNSLKHGQGQEKFQNGDTYKGEYQNNRFDGFGTYTWKQGQATYQGSFKNGLRHGKGKWSSGETKYSGSYAEGLKQGYGELYFPSGNFYKGNFLNDKRQGYGEMFWTDGSFYKGDWKGGVQNGKGQIYLTGGEVISGLFENGILVQVIPSLYQKQMEISSMGIQDLFGSNPKLPSTNKTRTFSESRGISNAGKKKLAKIDQHHDKKKKSIKDNLYFQSPEKNGIQSHQNHKNIHNHPHNDHHNRHMNNNHFHNTRQGQTPTNRHLRSHNHSHSYQKSGQGRDCKCMRRLQNFRLRQRLKTKLNQSKVDQTLHENT